VPVQPPPSAARKIGALAALLDGQIARAGGARRERDGDGLVAFGLRRWPRSIASSPPRRCRPIVIFATAVRVEVPPIGTMFTAWTAAALVLNIERAEASE
jgi:hypothetical protein